MQIKLSYSHILDSVTRQLSVIAKRASDGEGNSLYEDVTLGSNELPAVNDYAREAASELTGVMKQFVQELRIDEAGIVITYLPPPSCLDTTIIQGSASNYVNSYCLEKCLALSSADLAEKESTRTASAKRVFSNLLFATKPHHADFSLNSCNV